MTRPPDVAAPGAVAAATGRGERTGDDGRIAPAAVEQLDAARKAFLTVRAEAARAGCALYELAGGGYLLCRWSLSRELPDLRAVTALVRRVAGGPA